MSKSYETRLGEFEKYLRWISKDCEYESKLYDREDIYQEMCIVLYRCHGKYATLPDGEFKKVFVIALNNMLAGLFRRRRAKEGQDFEPIGEFNRDLRGRDESGVAFYSSGIQNLTEMVDAESVETIKYLIEPPGRVETTCPGFEHALREAKRAFK